MSVQLVRYQLNVDQYERLLDAGVLPTDARVELIEGELLAMTPIGTRHMAVVKRLNRLFARQVGDRALLSVQDAIQLDEHSLPEPDIALLRPDPDDYAGRRPAPGDVLLLVEVADSSAAYDRDFKARLYAAAGIVEYWVVDLRADEIVVWTEPAPRGYRRQHIVQLGDSLAPAALPDLQVDVADLLR